MFGIGENKENKETKKEETNLNIPNAMFGRDFEKQNGILDTEQSKKLETLELQNQTPIPQPPIKNMPSIPKASSTTNTQMPKNIANNIPQNNPVMQPITSLSESIDSLDKFKLPSIPKDLGWQNKQPIMESKSQTNDFSFINPIQKTSRPFTDAKGPVFVSVKRYKELIDSLNNLKSTASHLRQIVSDLKQNRDTGTNQLSQTADALSSLEKDIERVSASIKA